MLQQLSIGSSTGAQSARTCPSPGSPRQEHFGPSWAEISFARELSYESLGVLSDNFCPTLDSASSSSSTVKFM